MRRGWAARGVGGRAASSGWLLPCDVCAEAGKVPGLGAVGLIGRALAGIPDLAKALAGLQSWIIASMVSRRCTQPISDLGRGPIGYRLSTILGLSLKDRREHLLLQPDRASMVRRRMFSHLAYGPGRSPDWGCDRRRGTEPGSARLAHGARDLLAGAQFAVPGDQAMPVFAAECLGWP